MKKLIFTQGDETRPKFEDLRDEATLKESIFADIYDSAFTLIKEISKSSKHIDNKHNRERNNIIAFIGERGSGKTSCLKSIYHSLNKQQGMALQSPIDGINVSFNNKLPIIDPSYFDEQSNIIEIVIAHMFKSFKDAVNRNNHNFDGDNLEIKRELVKRFQDVKDALDYTKPINPKSVSNDSIEQLSKLASGSNLHDSMEKLVGCYLDYFKSESDKSQHMLVIAIDDLDVQTNHTYQMVEQIRKYLIIDNVIILMGVKLVQLSNLIKKKFLDKNNDKNNEKEQEVNDMVARYLMKLLPLSHRLNLPSYNDMPEIELAISSFAEKDSNNEDYDSNAYIDSDGKDTQITKLKQSDEIINLYETILALIYRKTGLMFYNFYQESLIIPHNLRELLNLIAMLNNMSDGEKSKNRSIFKQYFIESWCLDRLTPKQYAFIHDLNECDAIRINQFVAEYVITEYHKYFENNHELLQCKNRPYYLVSIADVHSILNILSNSNETSIKRLVFAVKTVYSMILYSKFIEMQNENNVKFHADLLYKYLTNGKISYKSINQLSHIFDYEKMIGGNIINYDEYNTIESSIYYQIYNYWHEKLKTRKQKVDYVIYNSEQHGPCDDFNNFELCLLSTYQYTFAHTSTRYYNSFPIYEYSNSGKVKLNYATILYNITRYFNLYKMYEHIHRLIIDYGNKEKELTVQIQKAKHDKTSENIKREKERELYIKKIQEIENLELVKFFKLIKAFGKNSIIYKLVADNNSRQNYMKAAIVSIEILDLLNDYMNRKDINTANPNAMRDIVKKISDFKYYVYRTNIQTLIVNDKKLSRIVAEYNERGVDIKNVIL